MDEIAHAEVRTHYRKRVRVGRTWTHLLAPRLNSEVDL